MNIALLDDEAHQLNTLKATISDVLADIGLEADKIDCYTNAESFFEDIELNRYDIIILDIYMHELNGIDVARKIREYDQEVAIAFCTSSNEYAAQSYEVDAKYYLQKPISKDKVSAMLKRINLNKIERNRSIRLPDGFRIPLRHIIFEEYINHSVQFHIRGQKPRIVRANQSEIEGLLLHHKGFCVINKGCIVNFDQVKAIEANTFIMHNGEKVSIARRRFKEIEKAYTEFLFKKMDEEASF